MVSQQVVQNVALTVVDICEQYSSKQSLATGIVQIVLGGLCMAFNTGAAIVGASYWEISGGFYGGLVVSNILTVLLITHTHTHRHTHIASRQATITILTVFVKIIQMVCILITLFK